MTKNNEANLNVVEENEEVVTPSEKRKMEKEKKKLENYSRGMISRQEAFQMSKSIAVEEVGHLANFIRDPLRANMVQTMALVELLIAKGYIENEAEFQVYLDKVADKLQDEVTKMENEKGDNNESEKTQD